MVRVRVRLWIVWCIDVQTAARSTGGGDQKWLCMLRVQSRSVCRSCHNDKQVAVKKSQVTTPSAEVGKIGSLVKQKHRVNVSAYSYNITIIRHSGLLCQIKHEHLQL